MKDPTKQEGRPRGNGRERRPTDAFRHSLRLRASVQGLSGPAESRLREAQAGRSTHH